MLGNKQSQTGGHNSTNVQGENVEIHHHGMTYQQVRQIAQDVFEDNFLKLKGIAKEIAEERAKQMTEMFLKELRIRNPDGLIAAHEPDMQDALFKAQKEYAKAGDEELGDILVDLLVDRTAETERTLKRIVLNESVDSVAKLTPGLWDTLSLIFLIRHTRCDGLNDHSNLKEYLNKYLVPFVPRLSANPSNYQHLMYAGCGTVGIGSCKIGSAFRSNYPWLFCKGFPHDALREVIGEKVAVGELVSPCLNDPDSVQLKGYTHQSFQKIAEGLGLDPETVGLALSFQNNRQMNDQETEATLLQVCPKLGQLLTVWEKSSMKNTTLSSVGIAIAHANVRKKTGDSFDLGIWIK